MSAIDSYRGVAREHGVADERLLFLDRVPYEQVPLWSRAFDVAATPFPDAAD